MIPEEYLSDYDSYDTTLHGKFWFFGRDISFLYKMKEKKKK